MNPGGTRFGALLDMIDEERSHLGCRLHDTVIQNLAALSIHLSLLERVCADLQCRETIQQCTGIIDASIKEVRSISSYLNPVLLPELDFEACLRSLAQFAAADGMSVHLDMNAVPEMKLSRQSRDGLFRLVWGAVRAIGEAGARDIQVSVTGFGGLLRVLVHGGATHQIHDPTGSLTWWIVQERADRLGGKLKINVHDGLQEVEFTIRAEDEGWCAAH